MNLHLKDKIALVTGASRGLGYATPEEFANAAVFIVSPAASYLTGVMLMFDGGMYKATY